jgi:hypothetical protein
MAAMRDGQHDALIERGCRKATFLVRSRGSQALNLILRSPSGRVIGSRSVDPDVRYVDRGSRFNLVQVTTPEPGMWTYRVGVGTMLSGVLFSKPPRDQIHYRHYVFAENERVHFVVTTDRMRFEPGESIHLIGQISAPVVLTGCRVTGSVTGPGGKKTQLEMVDDGNPRYGSEIPNTGRYSALFSPTEPGAYSFSFVADNSDSSARPAEGGDRAPGARAYPRVFIPRFVRWTSHTVLVGKPKIRGGRLRPKSLKRGYKGVLRLELDHIPWVPGVSKLVLGRGIEVKEKPKKTLKKGYPVFQVKVSDAAVPGFRDAVVVVGGARYRLEGAFRVRGKPPKPIKVDPDRAHRPGYVIRKSRNEKAKKKEKENGAK